MPNIIPTTSHNGRAMVDLIVVATIALMLVLWVATRFAEEVETVQELHPHGAHGGVITSLAGDRYHAELLIDQQGILRLFTLGQDETEVIDVPLQELSAYVNAGQGQVATISLTPTPHADDPPERTSQFAGQLPEEIIGLPLDISISTLRIEDQRFRLGFAWADEPAMPSKVEDEEERQLYLEPGGLYTETDIKANGEQTASAKFGTFKAKHDFNPQPGDLLCPITRTKGNPECTWIIGGQEYQFCCPPCIDEFVILAKTDPDQIQPPEAYVK